LKPGRRGGKPTTNRLSYGAASEEVKTGSNLAESSKGRLWLKKGCLANDDDVDFTSLQ
jgi:hypothetical protein